MNDIAFIVFTNENYFNLLELTLPFTIKNTKDLDTNIYVVSNKIPNSFSYIDNNVTYIDANVSFSNDGGHFGQVLLNCLPKIKEKYIVFLCDDYLIKSVIKKHIFNDLINLLEDLQADYLALGTQKHLEYFLPNWNKPNIEYQKYTFPSNGSFYEFDNSARHMYSVQPCIWKKISLIELLNYNPYISLHQLDNTDILNKKGQKRQLDSKHNFAFYEEKNNFFDYNFKNYCYHYPPLSYHVDEKSINDDYFVIDYIEIVRHGKFINYNVNSKLILDKILLSMPEINNKLQYFY